MSQFASIDAPTSSVIDDAEKLPDASAEGTDERLRANIKFSITRLCRKSIVTIEGLPSAGNAAQYAHIIDCLTQSELERTARVLGSLLQTAPASSPSSQDLAE